MVGGDDAEAEMSISSPGRSQDAREPKTWKWVSMRPPFRWSRARDTSIWAMAMTCLVSDSRTGFSAR